MKDNIGWIFYKGIYRNLDIDNPAIDANLLQEIENKIFRKAGSFSDDYIASYGFKLKVAYPGLLIGIGYAHGIPDDNDDIKSGFYFDYISGYPVIPGSSVKGILKSFFGGDEPCKDEFLGEKSKLIKDILQKQNVDIEKLRKEIFDGVDKSGKDISIYKRDKFLDAYVLNVKDKFLIFDYITPHKKQFKDPEPIRFLKVAPGVEFLFNFELNDGIISAEEKERLFFELLKLNGVGAKTNSGYGSFEDEKISYNHSFRKTKREEIEKKRQKLIEEQKKQELLKKLPPHERIFEKFKDNLSELINDIEEIAKKEEADIVELAKLIKKELQKSPKNWEKAKKKALKRKEKIQKILNS